MNPTPPIPHDLVQVTDAAICDAAICLWDAIQCGFLDKPPADGDRRWQEWYDYGGSSGIRHWCIVNAHTVEDLWRHARDVLGYEDCFDFEFVPLLLATCILWSERFADPEPMIRPDSRDILRGVIALSSPH
jgi:hypothetical protein